MSVCMYLPNRSHGESGNPAKTLCTSPHGFGGGLDMLSDKKHELVHRLFDFIEFFSRLEVNEDAAAGVL